MTVQPDLSEFRKLSRPKKKPCPIGNVRPQLSKTEAKQFDAAVADTSGQIATGAIQEWLAARGHDLSVPCVTAHRKGTCSCNGRA